MHGLTVGGMVSMGLRDFSYRVTVKVETGYYASKTIKTLFNLYRILCGVTVSYNLFFN